MGVVQSVPTQQLSPFYLLSTRDVSRVISFTRPSSRLTFSGKGSTAREDGLGTRLEEYQTWVWDRDYLFEGELSKIFQALYLQGYLLTLNDCIWDTVWEAVSGPQKVLNVEANSWCAAI